MRNEASCGAGHVRWGGKSMDSLLGGSCLQDRRVSAPTTAFRWQPHPALSHGNGRRGRFSHSPDLQRSTHVSGWTYRTKFHLGLLTSRGCWHTMVSKWRVHGPEGRSRAHRHRRRTSMIDGGVRIVEDPPRRRLSQDFVGCPNDFVVQNAPKQGRQSHKHTERGRNVYDG